MSATLDGATGPARFGAARRGRDGDRLRRLARHRLRALGRRRRRARHGPDRDGHAAANTVPDTLYILLIGGALAAGAGAGTLTPLLTVVLPARPLGIGEITAVAAAGRDRPRR
ncbi:hypothetical protein [Streptomyces sp. NPDC096095]|uniref:hypothetical protein n=1 Tax=Streptomyces sp. NPDC096095 TaxID=3155545 RepID=UPI0033210628